MNGIIHPDTLHERELILLLGSNINPEYHLRAALSEIRTIYTLTRFSSIWESLPVGSSGGNFLNQAVGIKTSEPLMQVRFEQLREIETRLGRVRGPDKYAARTIDIDVILDDHIVVDDKLWHYAFICVPVSELVPNLLHPESKRPLKLISGQLMQSTWIQKISDLSYSS